MTKKVKGTSNYTPFRNDPSILVLHNEHNPFGSNYVLPEEVAQLAQIPMKNAPTVVGKMPTKVLLVQTPTESTPFFGTSSFGLLGAVGLVVAGLIVVRHIVAPLMLFALFWVLVGIVAYGLATAVFYSGLSMSSDKMFFLLAVLAILSYILVLQSGKAISSVLPSF